MNLSAYLCVGIHVGNDIEHAFMLLFMYIGPLRFGESIHQQNVTTINRFGAIYKSSLKYTYIYSISVEL